MRIFISGAAGFAFAATTLLVSAGSPANAMTVQQCIEAVQNALPPTDLPFVERTPAIAIGRCRSTKNRPALAIRESAHNYVVSARVEAWSAADAKNAKAYPGKVMAMAKALNIGSKFADPKEIAATCADAKGHTPVAVRNFLDRFAVAANLAPTIIKRPAAEICASAVLEVGKQVALGGNDLAAYAIRNACGKNRNDGILASAQFLSSVTKAKKITATTPKPASDAQAKTCPSRLAEVAKTLAMMVKHANSKTIDSACQQAKGKPIVAANDLIAGYMNAAGIK